MSTTGTNQLINNKAYNEQLAQQILTKINGIQFGAVEITVHDGRIVQIERKEKLRFTNTGLPLPR